MNKYEVEAVMGSNNALKHTLFRGFAGQALKDSR